MKSRVNDRRGFVLAACFAALLPFNVLASKASYPERPISIIVGTSAGGPTDAMARAIANRLHGVLGQSVIVVNRDGASGMLANQATARAPSDGYTLQVGTTSSSILAPLLAQGTGFDTNSLAPIARVGATPMVLFTSTDVPAKTGSEFVQLLRKSPGEYAYATAGVGSTSNVSGELFKSQAAVDMLHVPYKGGAQLNQSVIAGDTKVGINTLGAVLPLHQGNKVRILMVLGDDRSSLAPEIPSAREAGIEGVDSMLNFYLMAHANTPAEIVEKLNAAVGDILADPNFEAEMKKSQVELHVPKKASEVRAQFDAERKKWSVVTEKMKASAN